MLSDDESDEEPKKKSKTKQISKRGSSKTVNIFIFFSKQNNYKLNYFFRKPNKVRPQSMAPITSRENIFLHLLMTTVMLKK